MPFLGGRASASRGFFGGGSTPTEPTNLSSIEGNQQLTISFDAPSFNGGLNISNYEYALSTNSGSSYGAWTPLSPVDTSSPIIIGELTNGQEYYVKLRAANPLGGGQQSDPLSTNTTPYTVPGKPSITGLTPGNGQVEVTYSAPASNGGRPITNYYIQYSSNNGSTWSSPIDSGSDLSHPVTGLSNGTNYVFRVYATNIAGNGPVSDTSSSSKPRTVPAKISPAPTSSAGDRSFTISWTAPNDGGSDITGYRVQYSSDGGSTWVGTDTTTSTSYSWVPLTNGTSYIGKVQAYNIVGNGEYSDASVARTPTFSAPALSGDGSWASSASIGVRRVSWTVDPTDVYGSNATAGTTTEIYLQWMYADGTWSTPNAAEELVATYTGNQSYSGYGTAFANSGTILPGEQYRIRAKQYSSAEPSYAIYTSWVNIQIIGYQTQYYDTWVGLSNVSSSSELVSVTGTSFTHTYAAAVGGVNTQNYGDIQHRAVSVYITSYTGDSGTTICTSSRYWGLFWSGNSTSGGTSGSIDYTGLQQPWSNNTGSTQRSATWTPTATNWGAVGAGRVSVKGFGTIATWSTSPDQRIRVRISVNYERRQWTQNGGSFLY